MDVFRPFDRILLVVGCQVNQETRIARIANLILKIIFVVISISSVIADAIRFLFRKKYVIQSLAHYTDLSSGIFFILLMTLRRDHIRSLFIRHVKSVTCEQRRCLHSFAVKESVTFCLTIPFYVPLVLYHLIESNADVYHVMDDILTYVTRAFNWFPISILIFLFIVKIVETNESNYFSRVSSEVMKKSPNFMTDYRLAGERKVMVTERKELLACLSIVPCMWFADVFLQMSAILMDVFEGDRYYKLTALVIRIIFLVVVVATCESCAATTEQQTFQLLTSMTADASIARFPNLTSELEQRPGIDFEVWSLFRIRRQIVLPFVSSLITFTVLFIQIAHQV